MTLALTSVNTPAPWHHIANANLIAAAPDLLAACKDALYLFQFASFDNGVHSPSGDSEGEHWGRLCREQLEKAIAKATTTL